MTVIGFTGHRDLPVDRRDAIELALRQLIAELSNTGPTTGCCSLAEGADHLFAGLIIEAELRLDVVIPGQDFEQTLPTDAARRTFRRLRDQASSVEVLDGSRGVPRIYVDVGGWIVRRSDLLVAAWDGGPSGGRGGTADVVAAATAAHVPVHVVWPEARC